MSRRGPWHALLAAVLAAPAYSAAAKDQGQVWTFGLTGLRQSLKTDNDNELIGNSGQLQIGGGYVAKHWYYTISADIIQGPYEPTYKRQLNVEYSGYGATVWSAFSAQNVDLRSTEGGYGFALGVSYGATTGRMNGKNRQDSGQNTAQDRSLTNDYTMQVSNLSLLPAIFFSWLAPARPVGNTPELLATRIEGYVLLIGAATPVITTYDAIATGGDGVAHHDHGNLNGYSILISLQALFGT